MKKISISFLILIILMSFSHKAEACGKDSYSVGGGWCRYYNCGNVHDGQGGSWTDQQICSAFGDRCNPPPPPPVNGKCNPDVDQSKVTFNTKTGNFEPRTTNHLCLAGRLSGGSWSNGSNEDSLYSYNCLGLYGGKDDLGCNPWKPTKKDAICGKYNGKDNLSTFPLIQQTQANLCSSGPAVKPVVESADDFKWSCLGTYGGNNASCKASKSGTVGKCGTVSTSGIPVSKLPVVGLCEVGTIKSLARFDKNTQSWNWICKGSLGESGTCSVKKGTEPVVDLTEINVTAKIVPSLVDKGEYCTLKDLNFNVNEGADSSKVLCNVYRGSEIYEDKIVGGDYQVEPGYDYVYKCTDLSTGVSAQSSPLKCVLNPSVIER